MKTLFKLLLQAIFFLTVVVNAILIVFLAIATYDRLNGMKSLNLKEFLIAGIVLLVLTSINILFYKSQKK